jgi:predicted transcriptional regulator
MNNKAQSHLVLLSGLNKDSAFPKKLEESCKPYIRSMADVGLNAQQLQLLKFLSQHTALTFMEIRNVMGRPFVERSVRNDLVDLREKGLIDSKGLGRAATWYCRK